MRRHVENPFRAKLGNEATRRPHRPTPRIDETQVSPARGAGDVLAQDDDRWVSAHLEANRLIDGLAERQITDGDGHASSSGFGGVDVRV
jgi:hypothetical protein